MGEAEHDQVVAALTALMSDDARFTAPVLDALSNLALRDEDPKELARLAGGSAELLTFPQSQAVEPAPAKRPATKMTLHKLKLKHAKKQPISVLTAYDYPSARLADAAGVDVLLVVAYCFFHARSSRD